MRGLFLLSIAAYMFIRGLRYPFVAGIAYIWTDIVKPQTLAHSIINNWPLSLISAVVVISSLTLNWKKCTIKPTFEMWLLVIFGMWITFTTFNANSVLLSWNKWDWAFKSVMFSALIPMLFRTRLQIEALLLGIVISVATITVSTGIKTMLGSGGYGVLAVMGGNNSGLAESSTLAAICVMLLPIVHYLYNSNLVFQNSAIYKLFLLGVAVSYLLTVIGTSARTGLVAMTVLLILYFPKLKKRLTLVVIVAAFLLLFQKDVIEGSAWGERMATIDDYSQESSAAGRIKVWEWTIDFVKENPIGGGFDSFKLNKIATVDSNNEIIFYPPDVVAGKAFHSIYFEVLGEQGIVGFFIYFALMISTWLALAKWSRHKALVSTDEWRGGLSGSLLKSHTVLLVGGIFIGIAYQPFMFYAVGIVAALKRMSSSKL